MDLAVVTPGHDWVHRRQRKFAITDDAVFPLRVLHVLFYFEGEEESSSFLVFRDKVNDSIKLSHYLLADHQAQTNSIFVNGFSINWAK